MQNNSSDHSKTDKREKTGGQFTSWMQSLFQMGLGDPVLHIVTNVFSILAIIIVLWMAEVYFNRPRPQAQTNEAPLQGPTPIAVSAIDSAGGPIDLSSVGIVRQANIHTNIPSRPRDDITNYVVQTGDTISSIADIYGLQPKTIFAANYSVLQDDPESLKPGQSLRSCRWMASIGNGQVGFHSASGRHIFKSNRKTSSITPAIIWIQTPWAILSMPT